MKKLFFALVLVGLTVSVFAQKAKSKEDLLKEMAALSATKKPEDTAKAYELGKEFLARFGKEKDKDKDGMTAKVRTFVDEYKMSRFWDSIDAKKYAESFAMGKEILTAQPDNADVLMNLAYAGYNSMGTARDKTYVGDSLIYAKKAVLLIESGAAPKSYAPFSGKEEATAFMYFVAGNFELDTDLKASAVDIYKAVSIESSIKKSALPYYLIANYYEDIYANLSAALKAKVDAKTINDADLKTENGKIEKAIDLMMDAYARTVKLGEAEKHPAADQWRQRLTQVYKFTKKTDQGLTEYINYINTMPLPDPAKF